jgi:hypothetical protein
MWYVVKHDKAANKMLISPLAHLVRSLGLQCLGRSVLPSNHEM